MSAEIKILIESYSESNLKETNSDLEKMVKHLTDISKIKNNKAKEASNTAAISKEIAELKKLQTATEKLKAEIDKVAIAKQKAADAAVVSNNKILASEEKVRQEQTKTTMGALKLAEAERKVAEQAAKNAEKIKRQNDAYGQLSRKHAELRRSAMNLAAAYGVESKQAIAAAAAANKLDVQLKKIDASTGVHTRNVGNYKSAWQGLNGVMSAFGITLGAGAIISGLKSSIEAFVDAEKNARALEFALKNVGNEGEIAFQKLIKQSEELQANGGVFSDDDIQKAQTQLVNYGLLSDEVEALMPKILDLATAQGVDLATATDTVIKGINGQTKGLKTVGLGFDDTGSRAENYTIILDKLTKFEGAAANAATTTEGKYKVLMNRFDDLKEDIGEFLIDEGAKYLDYWDVLVGNLTVVEMQQKKIIQQTTEKFDPATDAIIAHAEAMESQQEQVVFLNNNMIVLLRTIQNLNAERQKANQAGDTALVAGTSAQIEAIQAQYDKLLAAKNELLSDKAPQDFNDRTGDGDAGVKSAVKNAQKSAKELEYEKGQANKKARYNLQEYENQTAYDREQYLLKEIEDRRLANEEIKDAQEDMDYWRWQQEKETQEKLAEERKKAQEEMISDIEKVGDKVIDAAMDKSERELRVIQDQISEQDKIVDVQRRRAEQGLENTLAFEEKKKAEMERAAIAEQKKQQKLKQAEAYWSLLATYAKSDGDQAAQKAALEIAEGIAISAAFMEKGGMGEDAKETTVLKNGSWDKTHGSGDILTMISPKEGVLTEQNIAALGGKEGFYDLKYNLEKMGNNPINDDLFARQNDSFTSVALQKVVTMNTKPIEQKLDDVIDAVKGIVQNNYNLNEVGELIHERVKANSRVITNKGSFVSPRRNKYIN